MTWKINDKGKSIEDIYIMDVSTAKPNKKVLTKDKTYKVKDVISYKCMQFLDVGVEELIYSMVAYDCPQCKTYHLVKKEGHGYIYFPEIWFGKPEKDTRYNKLKRKIKKSFVKQYEVKPLILLPTEKPQEVPTRKIRRRKNKEIEPVGG